MKLLRRSAALALTVLLLAGCSAKTSPSPLPDPHEIPPAAEGPFQEEVLSYVDRVLAGDQVKLMCFLTPGSGPTMADLAPYKEEVRALFASLEWSDAGDQEITALEPPVVDWGYYLQAEDSSVNFYGGAKYDFIDIAHTGLQPGDSALRFAAKGASDLGYKLSDLHPGPEIRLLLTAFSADSATKKEKLVETYGPLFEEDYLASGHITDFNLIRLELVDPQKHGESLWPFFHFAFSLTPARPEDPYWAGRTADSDGRYSYNFILHMQPDENNIWRCDWFQTP